MSLKQAQDYAIQNNLNSKNAQIDIELAKKKIWETTAIGLPQISASANYQHIFKVPEMSFQGTMFSKARTPNTLYGLDVAGDSLFVNLVNGEPIKLGVANNINYSLTVSQLLFSGEYLVGLQASRVYAQMAEQNRDNTESDLREIVANSYYTVLYLQENKQLYDGLLKNARQLLFEMNEYQKAGFKEETDADQIQLNVFVLENLMNTISRQVTVATELFKMQIGLPANQQLVLSDDLNQLMGSVQIEALSNTTFNPESNITYKILTTSEALAELNLKREKSTILPSLVAAYQHTGKLNSADFDFSVPDVLQISLSVPIFSSGQRYTKIKERELELLKVRNSKEYAVNGLNLAFLSAKSDFNGAYETLMAEQKNIQLSQRIYDKTMLKNKEGLASTLELTVAQNQLITSQGNYLSSVLKVLTAKNKIDKLINKQ
jgi:outer membrane protein TolC